MKKKKWIVWILVMAVIFTASGFAYNRLSAAYEQNGAESIDTKQKSVNTTKNKADAFTVYDENKEKVSLSDYIGKPLVVNFWASWCPPCKREMPAFQEAVNLYGEKVIFLMINETDGERETMDTAQKFFADNGYNMKILFDSDGNAGSTYNILFLPRTLFIDEDGNIVEDHVGELTEVELTDSIKKLLPDQAEIKRTY